MSEARMEDPVRSVLADARASYGERCLPELLEAAAQEVRQLRGRPLEEQRATARLQLERAQRAAHRLSAEAERRRTAPSMDASRAMGWVQRLWAGEHRRLIDEALHQAALKQQEEERAEALRPRTW